MRPNRLVRASLIRAAQAVTASEAAIDVSGTLSVVSDYRFRGVSLSDRKPALQGGLDLTTPSGWFLGTWASSIARYGGANTEIDVYAGYARPVAGVDLSVGGYAYFYPGGHGVNYIKVQFTAEKAFGKTSVEAELSYVPVQDNVPADNVYAGLTVTRQIGTSPIRIKARGGFESGFDDRKWDWEGGFLLEHGPLTASASVIGSSHGSAAQAGRLAKTGLMAGLTLVGRTLM